MRATVAAIFLVGCGQGETTDAPAESDSDTPHSLTSLWTGPMPSGTYLLNLSVATLGGLAVPFQVDVQGTPGSGVISTFIVRGVSLGLDVSPDLVTLTDLVVDETGAFSLSVDELVIPGAYTITGSDVTVDLTLDALIGGDGSFCGTVEGIITSMTLPLDGSTFGTTLWADSLTGPLGCDPPAVTGIPRISDCPALVHGSNEGFPSGGDTRTVEVVLPAQYDSAVAWPLVFVFHGYGGNPEEMLDGVSQLRPFADERGVILVAPAGIESGGYTGWDVFGGEATNKDLALFDDLLTCASESFTVDTERVYATGMSFGGLMTGALLAHRSDVLAAAAPLSGGILTPFEAQGSGGPPTLVTWGGVTDFAVEQDFNLLALAMVATLQGNDQFVATCNHGQGHEVLEEFWPWILDFLRDHPRGVEPEPYAAGLPPTFPDYCTLPN